jgi:stearoyl-CoA desaturase (delta-9 desaturase)
LWQLHCRFEFERPPAFLVEPEFRDDPGTLHGAHLAAAPARLAALLYALGGASWAVWGVAVRVAVSVTSHWVVTYFAHKPGRRPLARGRAAVQGTDLWGWGFLTHGECWHNNHQRFRNRRGWGSSAGSSIPATGALVLQRCGWVGRIGLPRSVRAAREDLRLLPIGVEVAPAPGLSVAPVARLALAPEGQDEHVSMSGRKR